jgi:uncharacterized protein
MTIRMKIFTVILLSIAFISCSHEDLGPGYRWDLFKNTPGWELAQAVKKEDEATIHEILQSGKVNINFQEPKFGRTLLHLAVGNDRLISTGALIQEKANVQIRDFSGDQPIHEAVNYISFKKHTLDILNLLIKHGSNVNSISAKGSYKVPLEGAVSDLNCAKLLLKNGADPYYKQDSTYLIWQSLLIFNEKDNIYVARDMIVKNKMKIPDPITYTFPDHMPLSIYNLLNEAKFPGDPEKEKAKEDILHYLKGINFPNNGIYNK